MADEIPIYYCRYHPERRAEFVTELPVDHFLLCAECAINSATNGWKPVHFNEPEAADLLSTPS